MKTTRKFDKKKPVKNRSKANDKINLRLLEIGKNCFEYFFLFIVQIYFLFNLTLIFDTLFILI